VASKLIISDLFIFVLITCGSYHLNACWLIISLKYTLFYLRLHHDKSEFYSTVNEFKKNEQIKLIYVVYIIAFLLINNVIFFNRHRHQVVVNFVI